jgi:hypothetical protein
MKKPAKKQMKKSQLSEYMAGKGAAGGKISSEAKARASRQNGALGGRPRKKKS